ncbi:Citrate synthase (si) [Rhodococcus wratislaviensis]|uniref:Citrate synthase (Si) n=1 Tax=Rhodococcus wratislaviensis TaxID=44752 RepID=A0A402CIT2_RHOWR|nr:MULTISPECIES: hypothetical protein [Rhodococcus]GCE43560.1 Citrate synthase (si) [Rhodococcus wratislaviensis]
MPRRFCDVRASVMALSYVAQSARGIYQPAVRQKRMHRCGAGPHRAEQQTVPAVQVCAFVGEDGAQLVVVEGREGVASGGT